jgi:hypothetical protein
MQKLRALRSKAAPFKLADAEGLYVLVSPGGSKLWRLAYRFNGKQNSLALGQYLPQGRDQSGDVFQLEEEV